MKTIFKRIIFSLIVLSLLIATGFIVKVGKFEKLEGYMYSFAVENDIYNEENNATSGDAEWEEDYEDWEDTATGSNATSGDVDWEEDCEAFDILHPWVYNMCDVILDSLDDAIRYIGLNYLQI